MGKSLYQTIVENRAPTSSDRAVIGNWWIDTSASPNALYLYKASGWELQGGSGGSGKYLHSIVMGQANTAYLIFNLITNDSSAYQNYNEIANALYSSGYTSSTKALTATGFTTVSGGTYSTRYVHSVVATSTTLIQYLYTQDSFTTDGSSVTVTNVNNYTAISNGSAFYNLLGDNVTTL